MERRTTERAHGADYLHGVRALAPVLTASRFHEKDARELEPGLVATMHAHGLFRMLLPTWLGGGALDPLTYTSVIEEIASFDASAAWCVNQGSGCSMAAGYLAAEAAGCVFGGSEDVVAWGPSPGARATVVDGGYIVNYDGLFASGSRHATWLGAMCPVHRPDGTRRLASDGKPEMKWLLFPKHQAVMKDVWHVLGLRGTGSDSYTVRDLFVGNDYALRLDDEASRIDPSPHYRFSSAMIYASGFAHVALGIAKGFMADFVELASGKVPTQGRRLLRDCSIAQSEVAVCHAKLHAARTYLRDCMASAWTTIEQDELPTSEQRLAIRLASTYAIHAAKEIVDTLYDGAGSHAILESHPFESRFRDIHAVTQQVQGRKAHFEGIGRSILGHPLDLASLYI